MKVVILAGGLGSRISEESAVRPKPMVEIGGRPIIWHIMKIYSHYGFTEFIICLGYKGYMIKEYFYNYFLHMSDVTMHLAENRMEIHPKAAELQPTEPWKVTMVDTGDATQTGGRVKRILSYVEGDPFFALTYGDGLADIDIPREIEFHKTHGRLATMTVVRPAKRFGAVSIDGDRVTAFAEKPDNAGGWINGGFFLLSPAIGELIANDQIAWEQEPIESLVGRDQLRAYIHNGFWHPMDTLRDRNFLEEEWRRGTARWKLW